MSAFPQIGPTGRQTGAMRVSRYLSQRSHDGRAAPRHGYWALPFAILGRTLFAPPVHADEAAEAGQVLRHRSAEPASGAGDEGDLARETFGHHRSGSTGTSLGPAPCSPLTAGAETSRRRLPGSHLPPVGHCELGARQCGLSTRVCGATTSTPYRTPGRRPTKSRREAQGCAQVMRDLEVMLHLVTVLRNIHNPPLESARVRHQGARAVCARALDAAEDRQPAGKRADRIPSVPHLIAGRCQCWRLKP